MPALFHCFNLAISKVFFANLISEDQFFSWIIAGNLSTLVCWWVFHSLDRKGYLVITRVDLDKWPLEGPTDEVVTPSASHLRQSLILAYEAKKMATMSLNLTKPLFEPYTMGGKLHHVDALYKWRMSNMHFFQDLMNRVHKMA